MAKTQNDPWTNKELLDVAKAQKQVILSFLLILGLQILKSNTKNFIADSSSAAIAAGFIELIQICLMVYFIFWVYRLAVRIKLDLGFSLACIVLMIFPFINLITLIIILSKSNKTLEKHGIRVGLLGAYSKDLEKLKAESEQNQNQTPIIS